ncbi:MAG: hypothetical protein Q8R37_05245 [Nanoarchaeota archaeon]|nr:hypothetical protein [Nanoarchaeota archaeon]
MRCKTIVLNQNNHNLFKEPASVAFIQEIRRFQNVKLAYTGEEHKSHSPQYEL